MADECMRRSIDSDTDGRMGSTKHGFSDPTSIYWAVLFLALELVLVASFVALDLRLMAL